jgi:hypothetical protein
VNNPVTHRYPTHSRPQPPLCVGHLAQDVGNCHKGTDTIFFIKHNKVPSGRKVTYGQIIVAMHPMKKEVESTWLTIGINPINYPGNMSALKQLILQLPRSSSTFNSIVSTPDTQFMGIDLQNFYLNMPMEHYEYI